MLQGFHENIKCSREAKETLPISESSSAACCFWRALIYREECFTQFYFFIFHNISHFITVVLIICLSNVLRDTAFLPSSRKQSSCSHNHTFKQIKLRFTHTHAQLHPGNSTSHLGYRRTTTLILKPTSNSNCFQCNHNSNMHTQCKQSLCAWWIRERWEIWGAFCICNRKV